MRALSPLTIIKGEVVNLHTGKAFGIPSNQGSKLILQHIYACVIQYSFL